MKESRLEQEKCKNRGKTGVCEISQPLRNRHFAAKPFRSPNKFAAKSPLHCGIAILLRNHFTASGPSLRKFSQLRNHFWHTSAISQHNEPHFAATKSKKNKFAAKALFRRVFRSCETNFWHTSAISQHSDPHFAVAKRLRNAKA